MTRDLRELLEDTAARPTRPVDAHSIVRRAKRHRVVKQAAASSLVAIAVLAGIFGVMTFVDSRPDIALDQVPSPSAGDAAAPANYTIAVQARPHGEAPFTITGSEATIDKGADGATLQLTLTSAQSLLIDDVRWGYVDDEHDPHVAVAGSGCELTTTSGLASIGCLDYGRMLTIRPNEPLQEDITVLLPGRDPVGTYHYVQPVKWWQLAPDTGGIDLSEIKEHGAVDGHVSVEMRVTVQATDRASD